MTTIICRARVSTHCLHNKPSREQFGRDYMEGVTDPPLSEDATFNGESIICDACYIALMPLTPSGRGLHHELDAAIAKAKGA